MMCVCFCVCVSTCLCLYLLNCARPRNPALSIKSGYATRFDLPRGGDQLYLVLFTKISDQTRPRGHPFYATPIGPLDITMIVQQQSCPGGPHSPLLKGIAVAPTALLLELFCDGVCVCFLPIHSGHQVRWTYQPGSHRRKVTQDFESTFFLRCVP